MKREVVSTWEPRWWLEAWRLSGLDEAEQAFDIIAMTHPDMVDQVLVVLEEVPPMQVSPLCSLVTSNFTCLHPGPGACYYRPYIGIAHRCTAAGVRKKKVL